MKRLLSGSSRCTSLVLGAMALATWLAGCSTDRVTMEDSGTLPDGVADGDAVGGDVGSPATLTYAIADTNQAACYGNAVAATCAAAGKAFFGQDAQYLGHKPSYTLSKDGLTVRDNVTGLTWQRSPDASGDGKISAADKMTLSQAQARPAKLNALKFGGHGDWRLPTIKELYSLILFSGTDPSPSTSSAAGLKPFLDTTYFKFAYGDLGAGERIIDAQYATGTLYVSTKAEKLLFGVNLADGRIKGYGLKMPGSGKEKTFFVICVRGNKSYGKNAFVDNGDGTITDKATGLTWAAADSGKGMTWQAALAWAVSRNAAGYLGHKDWRLPSAKELQSIVDYSRSPDTSASASIEPKFSATEITNEAGQADYPFYWTSTTHESSNGMAGAAVYVAFGRSLGYMGGSWRDVHGAGSQRSDPKTGDPKNYPKGHGPQGDAIRIYNFVRLVRGGATLRPGGGPVPDGGSAPYLDGASPPPPKDGGPPKMDGGGPGPKACTSQSDCTKPGACPPDAKLGCACASTPGGGGKACIPACKTSADCPKPPGMTLICGAQGLCLPPGP